MMFVILHPAWIESGLVSVEEDGVISAEESVSDMLKLIERLGKEDSAKCHGKKLAKSGVHAKIPGLKS